MSDEKISVEITDNVNTSVSDKLRQIATDARSAHSSIQLLNSELVKVSANSGLVRLQTQMAKLETAQERLQTQTQKTQLEMARVETELNKAVRAENLATLSTMKLTAEQQKAAAAATRLAAENAKAVVAVDKLAAATAKAAAAESANKARLLQVAQAGIAAAEAQRAQSAAAMAAAAANESQLQTQSKKVAYTAEEVKAAQDATRAARDQIAATKALEAAEKSASNTHNSYNGSLGKTAASSQLARHHLVNLGFQVQDIGVSLASGQNPLTVFIQQGAQIGGIAAQAGVGMGAMAKAAAAMLVPFLPLVAALGAAYGALKLFESEVEKTTDLEKYAKSLGATSKQIKQLDLDTVTMTDTFKGLWKTLSAATGAGDFFDGLWKGAKKAFSNMLSFLALYLQSMLAGFSAAFDTIKELWARFPTSFKKPILEAVNAGIGYMETFTNATIDAVNKAIGALNTFTAIKIDPFENVTFDKINGDFAESNGKTLAQTFQDSFNKNLAENKATTNKFMQDWVSNTADAAQARIKKSLEDANGGKADKTAERRATTLSKINAELDNEFQRLSMLKPAREAQAKLDQIEESLISKKIKLNEDERKTIVDKIKAIQLQQVYQQQLDQMYSEATEPQETYAAGMKAAQDLLSQGVIDQQKYQGIVARLADAYEAANDPLYEYNKEMEQQQDLLRMAGPQQQIQQQMYQIQNDLLSKGIVLTKEQSAELQKQLELMQQLSGVNQAYNQIYGETQGALDGIKDSIDATNQAFQEGIISAEAYASRIVGLNVQAAQLRLEMGKALDGDLVLASLGRIVDGYTTMLAGLSNSFGGFFQSFTDGFADSVGRAIVYGDNLGESLQNVARNAVSELISSLVKLGVQWVAQQALSLTLGTTATTANIALGTATAAAWAPAAAMVSLASFGANAGPASAGVATTVALTEGLALAGFKDGGYTGSMGVNQIAGVVHGQEYVSTASATARYRPYLEAMNDGSFNPSAQMQSREVAMPSLTINNTGTPQTYDVQSWTEDDIRLIAKDVADNSVSNNSGKAVAKDLANPNSNVSKSLGRNTLAKRRR